MDKAGREARKAWLALVGATGLAILLGGCMWSQHAATAVDGEDITLAEASLQTAQISVQERAYPITFSSSMGLPAGINYDTGFWPAGAPIQLRLQFRLNAPQTALRLPGQLVVSSPSWVRPGTDVSVTIFFRGTVNAGFFIDAYGFGFSTSVRIDVAGLKWEGGVPLVPSYDLDLTFDSAADKKPFTPFLLGRTFGFEDSASWMFGLDKWGIKDLFDLTIGLRIGATLNGTLKGMRIAGGVQGKSYSWTSEGQAQTAVVRVPAGTPSGPWTLPVTVTFAEYYSRRFTLWAEFEARVTLLKDLKLFSYTSQRASWVVPWSLIVDLPDSSQQVQIALHVDGTAPVLSNTASPAWLPKPGGQVRICVTATDAHSGVERVVLAVTAPNGKSWTVPFTRTSGNANSGVWCASTTVPANPGETVQRYQWRITATDLVGNNASITGSFEVRPK